MDQAEKTMMDNIHKNTGKSFEYWLELVKKKNFVKHGEIIKFLKEEHGFTHGFANLVAHKSKKSDAGSADDTSLLIDTQFKGKEHFRPLYEDLISKIKKFGNDIEIAPKNAYVSLRRKKQFAILQPATKTRFEVQLILKGQSAGGILEEISAANSMCSHKINLDEKSKVSKEILGWLKSAYDKAG
jgi:predicted transport protein